MFLSFYYSTLFDAARADVFTIWYWNINFGDDCYSFYGVNNMFCSLWENKFANMKFKNVSRWQVCCFAVIWSVIQLILYQVSKRPFLLSYLLKFEKVKVPRSTFQVAIYIAYLFKHGFVCCGCFLELLGLSELFHGARGGFLDPMFVFYLA